MGKIKVHGIRVQQFVERNHYDCDIDEEDFLRFVNDYDGIEAASLTELKNIIDEEMHLSLEYYIGAYLDELVEPTDKETDTTDSPDWTDLSFTEEA